MIMENISVKLDIAPHLENTETAVRIKERFMGGASESDLCLKLDDEGLSLICDGMILRGDFSKMCSRVREQSIGSELLVRTAKIKDANGELRVLDATAGLGEDSLLLAAAGFYVTMYEQNPIIYELLCDAKRRAEQDSLLVNIVSRMKIICADSIMAMQNLDFSPDVVLLDPMFPERQKSALVKNKLQVIQKLEMPCVNEAEMLLSAVNTKPQKLIIKRPPKGPYLASVKPDYSIAGKAVRFDCIVKPNDKKHIILKTLNKGEI